MVLEFWVGCSGYSDWSVGERNHFACAVPACVRPPAPTVAVTTHALSPALADNNSKQNISWQRPSAATIIAIITANTTTTTPPPPPPPPLSRARDSKLLAASLSLPVDSRFASTSTSNAPGSASQLFAVHRQRSRAYILAQRKPHDPHAHAHAMSSSSSPDPLSLPSAPTISGPSRRLSSRRTPEPQPQPQPLSTSAVQIHSPTKMTAVSNSHLSPWRIKVMVEAERDGDDGERQQQQQEEEEEGCGRLAPPNFTLGFAGGDVLDVKVLPSARQRRSRERSVGVVTRTRTTKVPLKGLDSSPVGAVAAAKTKGRRATPTAPRRPSTPAPKSKARSTSKKAPVTPQPAATPRRSSRRKATAVEVEEDSSDEVQEVRRFVSFLFLFRASDGWMGVS